MARRAKPGVNHASDAPPGLDGPPHPRWPNPDRPITSGDQDALGRDRFAKRIAAVINDVRQVEESSVLAIVGPWGSGKSSVINLACAELKTLDSSWKVCPARIWASPDASGVIAEIFAAIRSALPDDRRAGKALDLLGKYAPLVTPALSMVPVLATCSRDWRATPPNCWPAVRRSGPCSRSSRSSSESWRNSASAS
jgi:hypothetical protein